MCVCVCVCVCVCSPGKSLWELVAEQFEDLLVRILLLAACVSFVSTNLLDLSSCEMLFWGSNGFFDLHPTARKFDVKCTDENCVTSNTFLYNNKINKMYKLQDDVFIITILLRYESQCWKMHFRHM